MYKDIYKDKKVLVTGNTGFKGSWLTVWLIKLGAKVFGISNEIPTDPAMFDVLELRERMEYFEADVRDLNAIQRIYNKVKPDFLFHLAAQPIVSVSYDDPISTISTNVLGTANILEVLRTTDHPCSAVIITSDKCYDNIEWEWGYKETDRLGGKDIYSGSKGAAELVIRSYYHSFFNKPDSKIRIASARAGNVIGGGDWAIDRIVPDCIRAWSNEETVEIRSPNSTRPWQHVLEPLSGYLTLGMELHTNKKFHGESFNFGPKSEYVQTVQKLIDDLSSTWNFEKGRQAYSVQDNVTFNEAGLLKLNCDKALFHLKWLPSLEYTKLIEFTGSWYYKYYYSEVDMYEYTMDQISDYETIAKSLNRSWSR